jgi:asparaginyl-tRNA synthetase
LRGKWQKCPPGKAQTHELQVSEATKLGYNDATVCVYNHLLVYHQD